LHITDPEATQLYGTRLLLVRPDQHIAWRGIDDPDEPEEIIQRVRGGDIEHSAASVDDNNESQEVSI
jgi:hypothetical protein